SPHRLRVQDRERQLGSLEQQPGRLSTMPFHGEEDGTRLPSNRSYATKEEAVESARIAYPLVPLREVAKAVRVRREAAPVALARRDACARAGRLDRGDIARRRAGSRRADPPSASSWSGSARAPALTGWSTAFLPFHP